MFSGSVELEPCHAFCLHDVQIKVVGDHSVSLAAVVIPSGELPYVPILPAHQWFGLFKR